MAAKPAPILCPLVAEGLRLQAEADAIKAERDAIALRLKAKNDELEAVETQLIALGAGRYRDEENHCASVIAEVPATLAPDDFRLKSADDEAVARELAGAEFLKLFQRQVWFEPRPDFRGLVLGKLTPKRAEDLLALTIVPGGLVGGRRAHVRWK